MSSSPPARDVRRAHGQSVQPVQSLALSAALLTLGAIVTVHRDPAVLPQDYRGPDGGPLTVHDNSVEPISDWAW